MRVNQTSCSATRLPPNRGGALQINNEEHSHVGRRHSDLPQQRSGIRQWMYASVVALECFADGFSDAVCRRAAHRGEAWHQAEGGGEVERLFGGEGTAIIGQPLDGVWRLDRGKAQ